MATSVPNTTTFTLQDVIDVVGGTSLTAAFANSTDAYFDASYKGSKNQLLNFRNYTVPTRSMTVSGVASVGDTCVGWSQGGTYYVTASEAWYCTTSNTPASNQGTYPTSGNAGSSIQVDVYSGSGSSDGVACGGTIDFYWSSDNAHAGWTFDLEWTYWTNCN